MSSTPHQDYTDQLKQISRDHAEAGKHQSVVPSYTNPHQKAEEEHLGDYSTELY